jgi:hypothetical protein
VASRCGLVRRFCPELWVRVKYGQTRNGPATNAIPPLRLDVADDGKQIKLLVRHAEIGLVCELHCYEGGPFQ